MTRPVQLLAIGLLCGVVIALGVWRFSSSESAPGSVSEPMSASPVSVAKESPSERVLPGRESEQTIERVKDLEKMVLEKRQRDQAAEKTHSARERLKSFKHSAWEKVIQTHRKTFVALRKESAGSPDKTVPCTICDAKGVLDLCVVCDHKGKCPTCLGVGKDFGEVCPPCQGSGKCFLCLGSGRMPCPFCLSLPGVKEVITPDTPDPAAEIPIN